ncbi:MAG: glycoside hydrolase family 44 protein [Myxococcales bacterium]
MSRAISSLTGAALWVAGCTASGVVTGPSSGSASSSAATGARGSTGGGASSGGATSRASTASGTSGGSVRGSSSTGAGTGGVSSSSGGNGSSGGTSAAIAFTVDLGKGPARQFDPPASPVPVSPYVYGVNQFAAWNPTTRWGLLRWGGDSFSDWNWTNNWHNSGSDYCFWQGNGDGAGNPPVVAGDLAGGSYPSVPTAQAAGQASLVTVPILGWVSSQSLTNNVWSGSNPACPGTPSCSGGGGNGYAMNVGNVDFPSVDPGSGAFVTNHPTKGSAFCTGTAGSCAIDQTGPVYQDEFVNYLKTTYGAGGAPLFFSLDNEPNYWPGTHPELWPGYTGTPGCGTDGTVTYADIEGDDIAFATAVKSVWPEALVFGPVVAGDGWIYARDYAQGGTPLFTDDYLQKLAAASDTAGRPLLDAFDIHYYTSNGNASQCLQVPRLFWDPNFTDWSPSETDQMDYGYSNALFDTTLYPRQLVPRLLGRIAADYAGHAQGAPGLSFSEYNPGCEQSIEGGVAEADLLGVFGREGVFAATAWPLKPVTSNGALANYLVAAYDLYRNYDGSGAAVGDLAAWAQTSDVRDSSVYAFGHSDGSAAAEIVLVNKEPTALPVVVSIASAPALSTAKAYQLAGGGSIGVAPAGSPSLACSGGSCSLSATLPPTSATTVVLR